MLVVEMRFLPFNDVRILIMTSSKSIKTNIILNCIKTAMSVIFPLITFPYISRILGTVGIGKINFSSSIVSYFTLLAALGVTTYALREGAAIRSKEKERDLFFNQVFTINFLSMCFAYLALAITVFISAKLQDYIILIFIHSLTLFFNWIGVEWVFNIYEDYLYITLRSFIVQLTSLVLMFILVRTPSDYIVYVCITVFASGGSYLFNYLCSGKYHRPRITKNCNIKKHLWPMLILAANLVAITVYVNADTTMIGFMLDEHNVGLYATAVKIYTIVKHIMAAVIASATARLSYYYLNGKKPEFDSLLEKMGKGLIMLCLPAMTGLFMTSSDVIALLAGSEYVGSIIPLKILSFSIVCATLGSFYSNYGLIIARREITVLIVTVLSALINILLNVFLIPAFGINGAAITTLISELFVFVVCAIKSELNIYKKFIRTIIIASIGCIWIVIICSISYKIESMILRLALSIILSGIGYIAVLIVFKEQLVISEIYRIKTKFLER